MPFLLKNFLNGQTKIPVQIYIRKIDHLKIDALTGHYFCFFYFAVKYYKL